MPRVQIVEVPDGPGPVLVVTLSQRNLLALVAKLATPGSRCAIACGDIPEGLAGALVRAEPDELFYASPTRQGAQPGAMTPKTERLIKLLSDTIEKLTANQPADDIPDRPL